MGWCAKRSRRRRPLQWPIRSWTLWCENLWATMFLSSRWRSRACVPGISICVPARCVKHSTAGCCSVSIFRSRSMRCLSSRGRPLAAHRRRAGHGRIVRAAEFRGGLSAGRRCAGGERTGDAFAGRRAAGGRRAADGGPEHVGAAADRRGRTGGRARDDQPSSGGLLPQLGTPGRGHLPDRRHQRPQRDQ